MCVICKEDCCLGSCYKVETKRNAEVRIKTNNPNKSSESLKHLRTKWTAVLHGNAHTKNAKTERA